MEKTYLIPAGKDCILPTRSEAQIMFKKYNIEGDVRLAIIERTPFRNDKIIHMYDDDSPSFEIVWMCSPAQQFLYAFERPKNFINADVTNKVIGYVGTDTLFFNDLVAYRIEKELDEIYIRQIEIFNTPKLVATATKAYGYSFEKAYLCQTRVTAENNRHFMYAWEIECHNKKNRRTVLLLALFPEEEPLLNAYNQHELGRHYLQNGEKIEHDGRFWKVEANKNLICLGLSLSETPARIASMKVVKKPH